METMRDGVTMMKKWTKEDTIRLMFLLDGSNRNSKLIQQDIMWDGGKFIRIHGDGKYGLLVGALEDEWDYYWIVEGSDLKVRVTSCVGGYDVVDGDIPEELSVLQWMSENDTEGLAERVIGQLDPYFREGNGCEFMTDLYFKDDRVPFKFGK